ncbi:iron-sulfur cluster biosynthesis family protein [Alicyclobacillus suci]|uniref:iron-sulfur cluster biosynthesis family protein n=2 Tax=Alicyclobacillus suci TaxID=2816080 RepID=UPI001A9077D9|nr:iron-sulfur cluster biosynthesis family protein [Alicyclobacillus suci]
MMMMLLTERCNQQLSKVQLAKDSYIRLSAEYEGGGCGCSVAVQMKVDERALEDECSVANGISFLMDKHSQAVLGDSVFELDFKDHLGYLLKTPNETLAYGIRLEQ